MAIVFSFRKDRDDATKTVVRINAVIDRVLDAVPGDEVREMFSYGLKTRLQALGRDSLQALREKLDEYGLPYDIEEGVPVERADDVKQARGLVAALAKRGYTLADLPSLPPEVLAEVLAEVKS